MVSVGGQIPNNLALPLHQAGVEILGTHPHFIHKAEDRAAFSATLDKLDIAQPTWASVSSLVSQFFCLAGIFWDEAYNCISK